MKKVLALLAVILLVSTPVLAQEIDYCQGDFDCDGDCDGTDAASFKTDFGRSNFQNPCPSCYIDIPKTGQTTSYATGDDGDLEVGFEHEPNPRFTDNGDGTVTDNRTRLIWMQNANCFGQRTWNNALSDCNGLQAGYCGLIDESQAGDWRLPNRFELESLITLKYYNPAIPDTTGNGQWSEGDPFNNVQSLDYWSSSTTLSSGYAWYVFFGHSTVTNTLKAEPLYVWCVRGGH